jgi:MFS family permease
MSKRGMTGRGMNDGRRDGGGMTDRVRSDGARAKTVVVLLFLFMLINWADKAVLGLSAVPIMRDLHLTHLQFGEIGSSFFLLFSISGIAVGFLVNRVKAKPVLVAMAVLWAVVQLPMAGAVGFRGLLLNRIVLGMGEGPALPVALHAVYKWFGDQRRTLPASIVIAGAPFGAGIVAPLMILIIVHFTWHVAFAALGVAGLVWAVAWQIFGREGTRGDSGPAIGSAFRGGSPAVSGHVSYWTLIFSRTAIGVFIAGFAAYWALTVYVVWLAAYLVQAQRFSPAMVGLVMVLSALAQIVLGPLISALSQRAMLHGASSRWARGVLAGGCVMVGGGAMILMPLLSGMVAEIVAVTIAFSIGGLIFPLGATMIAEMTPQGQRGAMLGIMNAVQTTAGLIAPIVMGHWVDLGPNLATGFEYGFVGSGELLILCGFIGVMLMRPEADRLRGLNAMARLRP